jgi:two-component system nitrogen regulation sensor histidine kinase NtrY
MVYKRFHLQYWLRIFLLCVTMASLVTLIFKSQLIILIIIIAGLTVYQAFSLLHVIGKPQRDITRFFEAIRYADFSQSFSDLYVDKSLQPLKENFTRVMNAFQKIRAEKEANYRYLQTVVQNIGVGVLVFKPNGRVNLVNHSARKLFGVAHITNINKLKEVDASLPKKIMSLKLNEKTHIRIHLKESGNLLNLSVYKTQFILQEEAYILISIQNIQSELEEKELEAWQNLIRVLTHEIMNSITPIASLASTAKGILASYSEEKGNTPANQESLKDVNRAVQTIETRSQGLLKFVQSYRQLTRIPKPDFKIVTLRPLFQHIEKLMLSRFKEKHVLLETSVHPSSLEITADRNLIEQVLINLLQNALYWCSRKPNGKVIMKALMGSESHPLIQVIDNGPGIQKEALEKIFIPFFTTKEGGSGIGLSLSKQIMRSHKGNIHVKSVMNKETIFTLSF